MRDSLSIDLFDSYDAALARILERVAADDRLESFLENAVRFPSIAYAQVLARRLGLLPRVLVPTAIPRDRGDFSTGILE